MVKRVIILFYKINHIYIYQQSEYLQFEEIVFILKQPVIKRLVIRVLLTIHRH